MAAYIRIKTSSSPSLPHLRIKDLTPHVSSEPLCFTANTANSTIKLKKIGYATSLEPVYWFSRNGTSWSAYTFNDDGVGQTITLSAKAGMKVYFKGHRGYQYETSYLQFEMTGSIAASGNINSLLAEQEFSKITNLTSYNSWTFQHLFSGCTSLTSAPELPATTLADACYFAMFEGCTGLTSAPNLPAKSLTEACYVSMFEGCTGLTSAPNLPATTLAITCYTSMFSGCTSLTSSPNLPSTTLVDYCYMNMFSGCSSLNKVHCNATDISADDCTTDWLSDVSPTGTFYKNPSMNNWATGNSGIPSDWTVSSL